MLRRSTGLVLVLLLAGSTWADDLAALAKKEKERRAKISKPTPVYTEADGKTASGGSVTTLPPPSAPAPASNPGQSAEEQKATWKARADAARAEIAAAEGRLQQLEQEYAAYREDMAEVPASELQDPMRLQKREARMVEMRAGLEQQRRIVANAKKSLSVLEDAARAAGVPPGWLR
jgi:DNA repair exonuclease SbcCD ATPase subunit